MEASGDSGIGASQGDTSERIDLVRHLLSINVVLLTEMLFQSSEDEKIDKT